jgi:hypothetical protein
MVVEKYLQPEVKELITDEDTLAKWTETVHSLGLTGQEKVQHEDKSPVPFMPMKKTTEAIFETLCPRKAKVADYDKSPIPMEVLDLIGLAVREKHFSEIQIWYDDKDPDPVAIGIRKQYEVKHKSGYNAKADTPVFLHKEDCDQYIAENGLQDEYHSYAWDHKSQKFLIARWGDERRAMEELREMARNRFIALQGLEYRKTIKEAQRGLDDLEETALERFGA